MLTYEWAGSEPKLVILELFLAACYKNWSDHF